MSAQADYLQQQLDAAKQRYRELEENITWLLDHAAEYKRPCNGCGVMVWFIKNPKTGKLNPYCFDGTQHFKNCPAAKEFKRG